MPERTTDGKWRCVSGKFITENEKKKRFFLLIARVKFSGVTGESFHIALCVSCESFEQESKVNEGWGFVVKKLRAKHEEFSFRLTNTSHSCGWKIGRYLLTPKIPIWTLFFSLLRTRSLLAWSIVSTDTSHHIRKVCFCFKRWWRWSNYVFTLERSPSQIEDSFAFALTQWHHVGKTNGHTGEPSVMSVMQLTYHQFCSIK